LFTNHDIAVLCINAPFPPFPMLSGNLIFFGTWRCWSSGFIYVSGFDLTHRTFVKTQMVSITAQYYIHCCADNQQAGTT